jgi:hypothetical protein
VLCAFLGLVSKSGNAVQTDSQWATSSVIMDDSELRRSSRLWFARSLGAWRDAIGSLQAGDSVSAGPRIVNLLILLGRACEDIRTIQQAQTPTSTPLLINLLDR